ncbi:MAG: hypothetical protein ACD_46C00713G0002 [uncultured bacterium]|nr:MAG: hypothetical protein ACD_46C00713G0002 [uncultured bacterium]
MLLCSTHKKAANDYINVIESIISVFKASMPTFIICITILLILFLFRNEIKKLISRKFFIKIGNNFGVHFGGNQEAEASQNAGYEKLNDSFENKFISDNSKLIRNQVIENKLSPDETISLLIRQLTNTQFKVILLTIDKLIFSEQIELLYSLSKSPIPFNKNNQVMKFFLKLPDEKKKITPDLQSFLLFLFQYDLIVVNAFGYLITQIGREYLKFRVQHGLPL